MAVQHVYSNAVADGTATSVVRPSDWNSYHNQYVTISGNTSGQSTISGTNIVFEGGNNVTLSANTAAGAATIIVSGGDTSQFLTTAMQSNAGSNFVGTNSALTANGASATIGSAGISLNFTAFQQSSNTGAITANALNTSVSSRFLQTSVSSNFFQTSVSSNLVAISNSSLFQHTSATSAITSNAVNASISSNFLTTAMVSNAGSNFVAASAAFNGTNISGTIASNGISLSAVGGGTINQTGPNFADVNGHTVTSGTVIFSNSNGVSFGLNGQTMTASYADITMRDFFPMQMAASSTTTFAQNTLHFAHVIPPQNLSMTCVEMLWSVSVSSVGATWTKGSTLSYGLYSEDPSGTRIGLIATSSMGFIHSGANQNSYGLTLVAGTNSATLSTASSGLSAWNQAGWKIVSLPFATSISAGLYYFGYIMSTNSTGGNPGMTNSYMMNNEASNASMGAIAPTGLTATNKSLVQEPYGFILSVTTGAMPSTVAFSDVSINSNTQPYLYFEA